MRPRSPAPHNLKGRLLLGEEEPIFQAVPVDVLDNLRHPHSENALLWNLIYPLAQPTVSLALLLAIKPLWGTALQDQEDDDLLPHFWGISVAGKLLAGLTEALQAVDGLRGQTEVDLILVGERHLIVAEVKNRAGLGRCARYLASRCPEVAAAEQVSERTCRYWEGGESHFDDVLDFGPRPRASEETPLCASHYQLARTLLVGEAAARRLHRQLHMWLILPKARWREHELAWLDFVGRVRRAEQWRRMRVLAWEDLARLPRGRLNVPREE
jgi:hypothetical protein